MKIKLYDFGPSPNCKRVKIALYEKGLPYEIIPIDIRNGEQKRPDYLKLNPYGKVPVLIDGKDVLFESCIINEYLEEKYPTPPLMPKDPYIRGRIRILTDYALNYIHSHYWTLRAEFFMRGERKQNQVVVAEETKILRDLLLYLEEAIGDRNYFMDTFTLLDIALCTRFLRMESFGILPHSSLPRLDTWLQRMKERPSVKAIL